MPSGNSPAPNYSSPCSSISSPRDTNPWQVPIPGEAKEQWPRMAEVPDSGHNILQPEKFRVPHADHSSLMAAPQDLERSPSYWLRKAALVHATLVTSR